MLVRPQSKLNNLSGTITTGGTAQNVYAKAAAPKHYLLFQNVSDTAMTIDFDRAAVANEGILIPAGTAFEFPAGVMAGGYLSVLCATTGKAFVCKTI